MENIQNEIEYLLQESGKSASEMAHGLKNIGNGDMQKGIETIADYFKESGIQEGKNKGTAFGVVIGSAGTVTLVGLLVAVMNWYRKKKEQKEKGKKIVRGLKQGIEDARQEELQQKTI